MNSNLKIIDIEFHVSTKYLSNEVVSHLFTFPKDMAQDLSEIEISTLDKPMIVTYYLKGWRHDF